jgi:hypothetical protein
MAILSTILVPILGVSLVYAVPNVTATTPGLGFILYGCYDLPNYSESTVPGWTGIGFTTRPFYFTPANSSIDGLRSTFGTFQGKDGTNSSSNMLLSTNSSLVHRLNCGGGPAGPASIISDEDSSSADQNSLYFTEDGRLTHDSAGTAGLLLQVYELDYNGTKLDGVYIGEKPPEPTGMSTTWAFEYHQGTVGSSDWYEMRILKEGEKLKDGEVDGFLKVVGM